MHADRRRPLALASFDAAYDEGRARRASTVVQRAAHVADDPAASTDDTSAKRTWRCRHVHNPSGSPRIRRDDAIATLFANMLICRHFLTFDRVRSACLKIEVRRYISTGNRGMPSSNQVDLASRTSSLRQINRCSSAVCSGSHAGRRVTSVRVPGVSSTRILAPLKRGDLLLANVIRWPAPS
jgi:hypothetical protein